MIGKGYYAALVIVGSNDAIDPSPAEVYDWFGLTLLNSILSLPPTHLTSRKRFNWPGPCSWRPDQSIVHGPNLSRLRDLHEKSIG